MRRKFFAIAMILSALLVALLGTGCSSPTLTADEELVCAQFDADAASSAADSARFEAGMDYADDEPDRDLSGSVDALIKLARKKPDAVYDSGFAGTEGEKRTMRQVMGDGASTLADSDPDMSDKLELALTTLP